MENSLKIRNIKIKGGTMKKVLLYLVFVILLCFSFDIVYAYSSTGYKEFEDIEILRDNVYLLNNTSLTTKKKDMKKVKWRFLDQVFM